MIAIAQSRTIDVSTFRSPSGKPTKLSEKIEVPDCLRIERLDDSCQAIPVANRCRFRVLHPEHGDERIVWDSRVLREIRAAKKLFMDFVAKGFKPHRLDTSGKPTGEVMKKFDPRAEEVLFLPAMAIAGG